LKFSKSNEISGNFDDEYISELICQYKGSIENLNNYINNLCFDIIADEFNPFSFLRTEVTEINKSFNIERSSDYLNIQQVILGIINKSALSTSVKYLDLDKESDESN
jgi:hypothetical protein